MMLCVEIYLSLQTCRVLSGDEGEVCLFEASVSTAKNGPGEMKNSECTPRGLHTIRACIGADFPDNTIFVGRRPTGELYSDALSAQLPERDWILTRIYGSVGWKLAEIDWQMLIQCSVIFISMVVLTVCLWGTRYHMGVLECIIVIC